MRKLIVFLMFTGICHFIIAQDTIKIEPRQKKYFHSFKFALENGTMLSNGTEEGNKVVQSSYYNGFDIRYGWGKNNPEDTYYRVYRFPTLGLGYYNSTFHNSEVGKPNALYFYLNIPIRFEGTKKWTGSYNAAFGLSYNFNPFDEINNPNNVFIGSYKNCYVHFAYQLNHHFNNNLTTFASIGFKHFSNGSFKQPNFGINLIPLSFGVHYRLTEKPIDIPTTPLPEFIKHNQWNLTLAFGSKNYEIGDPNYLKGTIGLNYLRQINYKHRMGVGLDVFYAAESGLRNHSNQSDFSKSMSFAVVGSWEWVLTRVIYVPIGIGYYLHNNFENGEEKKYYERIGMRFRLADHLNVGLTIKAHGGTADFFEWNVGYTFHKDRNKYVK